MSEVMNKLKETSSDGTSYSGDLLAIVDVLKNMTEIFRRAYYSPSSLDMKASSLRGAWMIYAGQILEQSKWRLIQLELI